MSAGRRSPVRRLLVSCAVGLLALCALEGLCSLGIFAFDALWRSRRPFAEREHTRYDPELGWVAIESGRFSDVYGPGRSLTTNERGFRGTRETSTAVPAGKLRMLCAGDSFTLGYGVADEHTWTARLEQLDPRIETLNLGQGGYGIDQAYLWFQRAASDLDFDLLVLAFIPEDFDRLRHDTFAVYGKPYLKLVEGELRVENVPVPKAGYRFPWLAHNRALFKRLGVVEVVSRFTESPTPRRAADRTQRLNDAAAAAVTSAVFEALERSARAKKAAFVIVHLPTQDPRNLAHVVALEGWPLEACEAARASGALFVDLTSRFQELAEADLRAAFLAEDEVEFPSAAGHYSARGNELVAQFVLESLREPIRAAAGARGL